MRKILFALLALLLFAPPLLGEDNVNSIAVFYDDGTYRHVDIEDIATLHRPATRYVGMHLYRLEPGIPTPKLTKFNGREILGMKLRPALSSENRIIIIREIDIDAPPSARFHREWALELGVIPNPVTDTNLPEPLETIMSGMVVVFYTMPFADADYDDMVACQSNDVRLNSNVVPANGNYYDKALSLCLFP